MVEINVFSCQKASDFDEIESYIKMSLPWARVQNINKFSSSMQGGRLEAQKAYENAYIPYLSGYNIALDARGETLSSEEFAKVLSNHSRINIFIGGAYGFCDEFKGQMQKLISLSSLTMAHKIAKLVLFEQIYRALSINANHPYHK